MSWSNKVPFVAAPSAVDCTLSFSFFSLPFFWSDCLCIPLCAAAGGAAVNALASWLNKTPLMCLCGQKKPTFCMLGCIPAYTRRTRRSLCWDSSWFTTGRGVAGVFMPQFAGANPTMRFSQVSLSLSLSARPSPSKSYTNAQNGAKNVQMVGRDEVPQC